MKHKTIWTFATIIALFSIYTAQFWFIPEVNYLSFFPPVHPAVGDQIFWDLIITGLCAFYLGRNLVKSKKITFGFVILFLLIGSPAILLFIVSKNLLKEN